jgi:diguanylate cyclase (GGDEF)-like protein
LIKNSSKPPSFKRDRPTIGVLAGWSPYEGTEPDNYLAPILGGIQSAATSRQCHLLVGLGVARASKTSRYPAWPVVSPEADFVPVGPWNTDGLIVFTPLASEDRSLYIQKLIAEGHPVLFIATGEPGPQVFVDNRTGIRRAIAHLMEHGHRHIAFIGGTPTDKGDSANRLNGYRSAVTEYKLETDPRLFSWGWHTSAGGYKAMREILDSGVKVTAVLASNDGSAVGAMRAIRESGLKIPGDIAIIGFDDQPDAMSQVPPLASVHVPLKMIGEQALISMLEHITQRTPLESLQIPTRLVKRQSCGCIPETISSALTGIDELLLHVFAKDGISKATPLTVDDVSQPAPLSLSQDKKPTDTKNKQHVVNEMLNILPAELRYPGEDEIRDTCTALIETFCKSLNEANPIYFQAEFMNSIYELERANGNLAPWQDLISILRREMIFLPLKWERDETRYLAEDFLHQARVMVSESALRQDQRHQYQRAVKAQVLNDLTAALSAALAEDQIAEILEANLVGVGIQRVKVVFFETEQGDPVASSLALNIDVDATPQRFLTRQFPPPGFYPANELLNIILLPLAFQDEAFGYVAVETTDLASCAVIAMQLAATIKVARLHTQVVELSLTDALTGLHNRRSFELFLKNEVSRSQRFSRSIGIILIDVDNFKEYNDTYGHPAGDEALQQVAKCLFAGRRNADIVARIGGDEFVVILPETELDGALRVGRKIRSAVIELLNLKRPVSVSIGLVAPRNTSINAELLIKQADLALYESKRNGRNRISVFQNEQVLDESEFPLSE